MSLLDKQRKLSQEWRVERGPAKPLPSKEVKKEVKKDTSGFGQKPYLTREEFRQRLRRPESFQVSRIPQAERLKLEKEIFGQKYGPYIERKDAQRAIRELERKKFMAPTGAEKWKIDKKIKLLKSFLGK